jgi:hypothetical protein
VFGISFLSLENTLEKCRLALAAKNSWLLKQLHVAQEPQAFNFDSPRNKNIFNTKQNNK